MRIVPALLALTAVTTAAVACGGRSHHEKPFAIRIALQPAAFDEDGPGEWRIEVVDTHGALTSWSGTISVSATGPVSPATITVTGGVADTQLSFALAGDDTVDFSAAGLRSAETYIVVVPASLFHVGGSAERGAVLGTGSVWDAAGAWAPSVVVSGAEWRLYYASTGGTPSPAIGLAVSTDGGVTFFRRPGPVLGPSTAPNGCHADGAAFPSVFAQGAGWTMLYQGTTSGRTHLCRATSTDGAAWTPAPGVEEDGSVLALSSSAEAFDNVEIQGASVISSGGGFLALYGARGTADVTSNHPGPDSVGAIGLARSPDGVTWTKVPGALPFGALAYAALESPDDTEWENFQLVGPSIVGMKGTYRVWASGFGIGLKWRLGRFASLRPDAIWPPLDSEGDPTDTGAVLGLGSAGTFDDDGGELPCAVPLPDGRVRVYYTGRSTDGARRIGIAETAP